MSMFKIGDVIKYSANNCNESVCYVDMIIDKTEENYKVIELWNYHGSSDISVHEFDAEEYDKNSIFSNIFKIEMI